MRLELGDPGLLDDDVLTGRRRGERARLLRLCRRLVALGLVTRLEDLAVPGGLGHPGVRRLLGLGGETIRLRLRDTRIALDGRRVRHGQVLDVPGRVLDLVDLQRVDDQAELLHLRAARGTGLTGELLTVADHVLDRQSAHDGTEMTGEHVVHPLGHQPLLVQEAPCRVGDGHVVVADLEDDHAPHLQRDALLRDAVDLQLGLVEVEGQLADRLYTGQHQRAAPGDDPEPHPLFQALGPVPGTRDDERLVRLGHPPHQFEQTDQYEYGGDRRTRDDADDHRQCPLCMVPSRHRTNVSVLPRGAGGKAAGCPLLQS